VFKVSLFGAIANIPRKQTIPKKSVGLKTVSFKAYKTICPETEAIDPIAHAIPKPSPLIFYGYSSAV
jgi:hypothetical protein